VRTDPGSLSQRRNGNTWVFRSKLSRPLGAGINHFLRAKGVVVTDLPRMESHGTAEAHQLAAVDAAGDLVLPIRKQPALGVQASVGACRTPIDGGWKPERRVGENNAPYVPICSASRQVTLDLCGRMIERARDASRGKALGYSFRERGCRHGRARRRPRP
jgi:hypothetical protein